MAIMHPRFTFLQTYFKYKRFSYLYESKDQSGNDPYNLSILNEECHEEDSDDKEEQQDIKLLKTWIISRSCGVLNFWPYKQKWIQLIAVFA